MYDRIPLKTELVEGVVVLANEPVRQKPVSLILQNTRDRIS